MEVLEYVFMHLSAIRQSSYTQQSNASIQANVPVDRSEMYLPTPRPFISPYIRSITVEAGRGGMETKDTCGRTVATDIIKLWQSELNWGEGIRANPATLIDSTFWDRQGYDKTYKAEADVDRISIMFDISPGNRIQFTKSLKCLPGIRPSKPKPGQSGYVNSNEIDGLCHISWKPKYREYDEDAGGTRHKR
jgi:hypothetical protein